MDDGGYCNPALCYFLDQILPSSFLSHLYVGSSLENLRIKILDSCCMDVTQGSAIGFAPQAQRMGSLKKLVLENIILSRGTAIEHGQGPFLKANSDTLEKIVLIEASWYVEHLERKNPRTIGELSGTSSKRIARVVFGDWKSTTDLLMDI
jgi:hypothetical protein